MKLMWLTTMLKGYFGLNKANYPALSAGFNIVRRIWFMHIYSSSRSVGQTLLAITR